MLLKVFLKFLNFLAQLLWRDFSWDQLEESVLYIEEALANGENVSVYSLKAKFINAYAEALIYKTVGLHAEIDFLTTRKDLMFQLNSIDSRNINFSLKKSKKFDWDCGRLNLI